MTEGRMPEDGEPDNMLRFIQKAVENSSKNFEGNAQAKLLDVCVENEDWLDITVQTHLPDPDPAPKEVLPTLTMWENSYLAKFPWSKGLSNPYIPLALVTRSIHDNMETLLHHPGPSMKETWEPSDEDYSIHVTFDAEILDRSPLCSLWRLNFRFHGEVDSSDEEIDGEGESVL